MSTGYLFVLNPKIINIQDVKIWCRENITEFGTYYLIRPIYYYRLTLYDETDAMAFKLRWL